MSAPKIWLKFCINRASCSHLLREIIRGLLWGKNFDGGEFCGVFFCSSSWKFIGTTVSRGKKILGISVEVFISVEIHGNIYQRGNIHQRGNIFSAWKFFLYPNYIPWSMPVEASFKMIKLGYFNVEVKEGRISHSIIIFLAVRNRIYSLWIESLWAGTYISIDVRWASLLESVNTWPSCIHYLQELCTNWKRCS